MANVVVPFKDYPAFIERVVLDGTPYKIRFRWNTVGLYWTIQFLTVDGTILISGIKIVLGYELINDHVWIGSPPGELYAIDPTGDLATIGRDNLSNGTVYLRYIPEADL